MPSPLDILLHNPFVQVGIQAIVVGVAALIMIMFVKAMFGGGGKGRRIDARAIVIDPSTRRIDVRGLTRLGGNLYTDGELLAIIPDDAEAFLYTTCSWRGCSVVNVYLLVRAGQMLMPVHPDDAKFMLYHLDKEEQVGDIASLLVKLAEHNVIREEFRITPTTSLALQVPSRNVIFALAQRVTSYIEGGMRSMSAVAGSLTKLYELIRKMAEAEELKASAELKKRMWIVMLALAIGIALMMILAALGTH